MVVAKYYEVSVKSLRIVNYVSGNLPRTMAIYLAAELSGLKFKFIAAFFKNINADSISQVVLRINRLKVTSFSINDDINNLRDIIQN